MFISTPIIDESQFVPISVSKTRSIGDLTYDFVQYERESTLPHKIEEMSMLDGIYNQVNRNRQFVESLNPPLSQYEENQTVRCYPSLINRQHEEFQYLDLIANIITTGFKQQDRTGELFPLFFKSTFPCILRLYYLKVLVH